MRIRIRSLDDLPLEEQIEIDLDQIADDDPVTMIAACRALEELGMDEQQITTNMRKIAYRRAEVVRDFLENLADVRQEHWQRHCTNFAKNTQEVGEPW